MNEQIENTFDYLMEEYTLPASHIPLNSWAMSDLIELEYAIAAEIQRRYDIGQNEAAST